MTATNQNGNWLDVTVGADMLLNQNIAAYAALTRQKIPLIIATICIRWGLAPDFNVTVTIETIE